MAILMHTHMSILCDFTKKIKVIEDINISPNTNKRPIGLCSCAEVVEYELLNFSPNQKI